MPDFVRSARQTWGIFCLLIVVCAWFTGCASWRGTEPIVENQFVVHYNRIAENMAASDPLLQPHVPPPSMGPGRRLTPPTLEDRWPISLAEAVRMGVENNSVIRQNAQFMSPSNPLMQGPDSVPSVFDPGIQNAGVLFGSRGVDAALSDFDPRLTSSLKWNRSENAQNSLLLPPPGNVLTSEGAQYQSRFDQQLLSGGVFGVYNTWNYALTNQPAQLFASTYTGQLGFDFRQPLWAGSGREFTAIAGPLDQRARGFSYVNQGIVIAHINKRLSEIDLQENLQNLVREIGDLYWDLYQNYQDYDSETRASKIAKELWDRAQGRTNIDPGIEEAQAEDAYYESKAREELALSNLFMTEARLRRLIGLSLDDPRMIFPSDEPREDEVSLSRATCLYEALVNRIELSRQKLNVQSLELQLIAARKLVAPKLDFVAGYGLNGFGDKLIARNTSDSQNTNQGFNSATAAMFSGKETSWDFGFQYQLPLWLRQEKAQVRQLELRIAKGRAALAMQEDEIAHELNTVLMTIQRSHSMSKLTRRRLKAARRRVIAAESDYEAGNKSNDVALRAISSLTLAQAAYSKSISEYNKSLRDLLFRTGRILPADGISILGTDGLPLIPSDSDGPFPYPADPGPNTPSDSEDPSEETEDPDIPPKPEKSPNIARNEADVTFSDENDETDAKVGGILQTRFEEADEAEPHFDEPDKSRNSSFAP